MLSKQVYRRWYESRRSSKPKLHSNKKIKYGEKRFSIWQMEFLHSAMWHDHDIDLVRRLHPAMWLWNRDSEFTKWQHPAMWYMALGWHATEFAQTLKRWRISAILDFTGPIICSLKSPCTTSYRSSIDTIALNCLVFWENRVFLHLATDRQTDGHHRCVKPQSCCRELRVNN